MLVLTRKAEEKIKIGDNIVITILGIESGNVRIGIDAPRDVTILRMEILEQIQKENIESAAKEVTEIMEVAELMKKRLSKE